MKTPLLTGHNAAMLLIDHQIGTMGWVHSLPFAEIQRNTLILAKAAAVLKMPVVLTSSMEEQAQGPLLSELAEILPEQFAARVKRSGIVDAMNDPNFAAAVKATERKKLIIAGVTTDVCVVFPAMRAVSEGYDVQVVADACGSPTKLADEIALRRMEKEGITLTSTVQLVAELAQNWTSPEGGQLVQILFEDFFSKLEADQPT
ncbi:MAG: isochorismatase family protein [Desulfopila sp.]